MAKDWLTDDRVTISTAGHTEAIRSYWLAYYLDVQPVSLIDAVVLQSARVHLERGQGVAAARGADVNVVCCPLQGANVATVRGGRSMFL